MRRPGREKKIFFRERHVRLAAPSRAALRALGPYARGRLVEKTLGQTLALDVPFDVFASQAVDEGTLLLLENLPQGEPRSLLDLGCGYGALGLPVAARWPQARCLLVDRDLVAVAASEHNARALGLGNVQARAGLGYRGLAGERFDWVLCNVPARIGARAIGHLLQGGARLARQVRVVVIRDLAAVLEGLGLRGLSHVARGPRHDVFALQGGSGAQIDLDDEEIYARDQTEFCGLRFVRPHDASEDPEHLRSLAVLAEALPRAAPARALVFRAGYGPLALHVKARFPSAAVVAQERDLLDAAFLRRNARALGLALEVRESIYPGQAAQERFELVVGELSAAAGPMVARRELQDAADLLGPRGQALILASARQEREWLPKVAPRGTALTTLLRREGASVLRISGPAGARQGRKSGR